ncbi:response regulator, partial [Escherichia coli]|uniref:response regulator n=1 Tax=Escherichia coli TaxID=562 RepID=UPI0039E05651
PNMDGMQATRCLRELGARYEHIPVIAITANAMPGARELYLAAGLNDYVAKPIDPDRFLATISDWLDSTFIAPGDGPGVGLL